MQPEHLHDRKVLAVDLDGTLLQSDMLFESFWSAFSRDWSIPLKSAQALPKGRAALKRMLAERMDVDITTLPYNPAVLEYIRAQRAEGVHTILVTATDQAIADDIAAHLDVFDEVRGSDGAHNLKDANKTAFLTERFGENGYTYMGDTYADLSVWGAAERAVTVNAPAKLRAQVDQMDTPAEHISTDANRMRAYFKAIRPHQWLKNLLVFLPMLTAHQLTGATFSQSLLAFIVFSLVASSVYVLNDLLDLRSDRAHPRKCKRPFAAGDIPLAHGTYMLAGLLGSGILLSLFLGPAFFAVMVIYYLATTAYSLWLKRKAIVDVCTLAGLYTLRIVAGAAATGIPLSIWLLAFSIFFFFSLATVKRQAELKDGAERGEIKAAGRGYEVDDLPFVSMMAISSGYVAVLVMALYVQSPAVLVLYSSPIVLGGICCVLLYWITRVVLLAHRGKMHDDPIIFAAKDRTSLICAALIGMIAVGGTFL